MTIPPLDARAHATIEGYLSAVAIRLTGPRRTCQAILTELHDGLLEAAATQLAHGGTPLQAVRAAVEEFGDPATIASQFAPDLAASTSRRVALTLAATGPLIGLLWLAAYAASRIGPVRATPPWHWPAALPGAWLAFPLIGAAVVIAVLATLLVTASTGRLSSLLSVPPSMAPVAAATVGIAAIVVDLTVLGLLAIQANAEPDALAWAPLAVAAAASSARLVLASRAARRCQTIRATLT
jgi:hypothetical protein